MNSTVNNSSDEAVIQLNTNCWTGVKSALPIVLGYLPIGFAFGVLAAQAGIGVVPALCMSIFVFAGSAQLIAVGLIGSGAGWISIALTTFVVNLRHLLMSAALAPYLKHLSRWEVSWFGFQMTDETFAVHSSEFSRGRSSRAHIFSLNATAHLGWVGGTLLGVVLGSGVQSGSQWGLDFALPGMFIALLVLQVKGLRHVAVAAAAALFSVILAVSLTARWNVIIATLLAAALGVLMERWKRST